MKAFRYTLCGWQVSSAFEIPELAPSAAADPRFDLEISLGDAGGDERNAIWVSRRAYVAVSGDYHIAIAGLARFSVSHGRRVVVEPEPGCDLAEMRVYLLGTVLAVLCYQRRLLPLHASCVEIGGRAVCFAGMSGTGKSTIAASLARRGFPVLSDDICPIDLSEGGPCALLAVPRVKLWPDSASIAGLADRPRGKADPAAKHHFHLVNDGPISSAPRPLAAIHLIEPAAPGAPAGLKRLDDRSAFSTLMRHLPRRRVAAALGLQQFVTDSVAEIVRTVPVMRLHRCAEPDRIDETIDLICASQAGA